MWYLEYVYKWYKVSKMHINIYFPFTWSHIRNSGKIFSILRKGFKNEGSCGLPKPVSPRKISIFLTHTSNELLNFENIKKQKYFRSLICDYNQVVDFNSIFLNNHILLKNEGVSGNDLCRRQHEILKTEQTNAQEQ